MFKSLTTPQLVSGESVSGGRGVGLVGGSQESLHDSGLVSLQQRSFKWFHLKWFRCRQRPVVSTETEAQVEKSLHPRQKYRREAEMKTQQRKYKGCSENRKEEKTQVENKTNGGMRQSDFLYKPHILNSTLQ